VEKLAKVCGFGVRAVHSGGEVERGEAERAMADSCMRHAACGALARTCATAGFAAAAVSVVVTVEDPAWPVVVTVVVTVDIVGEK
jgi:hypothetical protein